MHFFASREKSEGNMTGLEHEKFSVRRIRLDFQHDAELETMATFVCPNSQCCAAADSMFGRLASGLVHWWCGIAAIT